ncbi:hypothetical protein C9374_010469 [Naegleria lovaniensis]|uniref:Uncharacterized protein n=1 Tax=Naegleria lovaniensis TaxID=51637 RepID=A0AA88GFW1_NAELO|nr:uncharacterized protein C9374_010469 [Naegleria lovaniensis]KAG2374725.1 hypothetical protein C9374_010469 [Naegleria lovaniensis]
MQTQDDTIINESQPLMRTIETACTSSTQPINRQSSGIDLSENTSLLLYDTNHNNHHSVNIESSQMHNEHDSESIGKNHCTKNNDKNQNSKPSSTTPITMNSSKKLSLGLVLTFAVYSFFHMTNPQQPFLVDFLTSKGISLKTILFDIFPIWSYSMPVVQLCIGIISEVKFIGHKWVIVAGILSSVLFMLSEFFSTKHTVWMLQLTEIAVAVLYGTDQTYYALVYHSSSPNSYQFLTSLSRTCILMGQVFGAIVGQIVYMCGVSIQVLYYIGFACVVPCLYLAIFHFPSPKKYVRSIHSFETTDLVKNNTAKEDVKLISSESNYVESINTELQNEHSQQPLLVHTQHDTPHFQQDSSSSKSDSNFLHKLSLFLKSSKAWKFVVEVKQCYTGNFSVSFWSIYSIFGIAVHMLALTYYQTFFKTLNNQISLNGILIAVAYACAAMVSMIPTRFGEWVASWKGKLMAAIVCLACGSCLIAMGINRKCPIFVAYLLFVIYHCLFEFLYVVSFSQIAEGLKITRFAAIFSFNSALANVFQLLIQVLVGKQVLALNPIAQYMAFGIILSSLSVLLFLCILCHLVYTRKK